MALGLSVLICIMTVGLLAGRVYETISLTDMETGFLVTKVLALNPLLIALFLLITVCCGVMIFGKEKKAEPFFSKSSGIIADLAGAAFIACGIADFLGIPSMLIIAGGAALLLAGILGLDKTARDIAAIVLFTAFVAGLCLEVIIFDVYSVYNTEFLHRVLVYVSAMIFIIMVLKNVYVPSALSRMFLYISGFVCFAFCGMFSIAKILCEIVMGYGFSVAMIKDVAFILLGIYALDNALSVIPQKNTQDEEANDEVISADSRCCEQEYREEKPVKKAVFSKDVQIFKSEKTSSAKTEKIVYKKPKN